MGILDGLLDRSVLYDFDRSGFLRHQRRFDPSDLDRSLASKICLVTGANAGLGLAIADGLARRGAAVHLLCRSAERGARARDELVRATGNADVHLQQVDLSDLASIRALVRRMSLPRVDVLIHNAGVLPADRQLTAEGLELTVATHVVGPFVLTMLLRPRLRGARVIFVSSGGMYTKRLDVAAMFDIEGPYDGVGAYALTKRAQVVLGEQLAGELASDGTTVNAMHPGWAATSGVERSLPRFWRLMRERLRTPEQGADTALWLAIAERVAHQTGKFWFDRREVPTHRLRRTHEREGDRARLWELCQRFAAS